MEQESYFGSIGYCHAGDTLSVCGAADDCGSGGETGGSSKYHGADGKHVTRGVVDKITELPQYRENIEEYLENEKKYYRTDDIDIRGEVDERPFVVLEIVPDECYAEFGYQISGCEPVDMSNLYGHGDVVNRVAGLVNAETHQYTAYFFPDEPEGKEKNYADGKLKVYDTGSEIQLYGYYEIVEDGTGTFEAKGTGDDITFVKGGKKNVIWHTVNDGVEKMGESSTSFSNIGDRYYPKEGRVGTNSSGKDPVMITYEYYTYKNNDHFLRNTLQKSEEAAANFRIVVKTITPAELNKTLDWIQYADLINITPRSHDAQAFPELWINENRLKHSQTYECPVSEKPAFWNTEKYQNADISWDAALAIYNRVTEKEDYAALMMDETVYNVTGDADYSKKNVTIDIKDWNLNSAGCERNRDGYNNNMFKLTVMLLSMDSDLFKAYYLNEDNPVIVDGKNTLQKGDAAEYWDFWTFLLLPVRENMLKEEYDKIIGNPEGFWTNSEYKYWENYNITPRPTEKKNWTVDHVFTYQGGNDLLRGDYTTHEITNYTDYPEYKGYIDDNNIEKATPSIAVRYILNMERDGKSDADKSLKILDLEPSVALKKNAKGEYEQNWQVTEGYIRNIIPRYKGKIEITHQTTAEFNGKIEDLNSTYDMIYLGLNLGEYSAYATETQTVGKYKAEFPKWTADEGLKTLDYFHTGSKMVSSERQETKNDQTRNYSVKFVGNSNSAEICFPGNDISKLKQNDLQDFLDSGKPVVAATILYQLQPEVIDAKSNIYQYISNAKPSSSEQDSPKQEKNVVCSMDETTLIKEKLEEIVRDVRFIDVPTDYKGANEDGSVNSDSYLPVGSDGMPYLKFGFNIKSDNAYKYKIYVDGDRDSRFEESECLSGTDGKLATKDAEGNVTVTLPLETMYRGVVNWKIEVYRENNKLIRYEKTGCSAAKGADKENIKVLQIMPAKEVDNYKGGLNLAENEHFKKYYENLEDYNISITAITWKEFVSYFDDIEFSFDLSRGIEKENTVASKNNPIVTGEDVAINKYKDLASYDMMIFGFGDTYNGTDLDSIEAVQYIEYFIARGKSVLFTHDITSLLNMDLESGAFGSTANAMLRDVMGINRYKALSNKLPDNLKQQLSEYQKDKTYDVISSSATQGYTYAAMAGRLGYQGSNERLPYAALNIIKQDKYTQNNGFGGSPNITNQVEELNKGQITSYPYAIDSTFEVAPTHAQWYQSNIEDDELTVWYALNDSKKPDTTDNNASSLTYQVSPNDASNNYYIYSKGNVFYSGVGHSTDAKGNLTNMEAKLFVNTMIAAYRRSPGVEVNDLYHTPLGETTEIHDGVQKVAAGSYTGIIPREYDTENDQLGDGAKAYKVYFIPVETNKQGKLKCSISLPDMPSVKITQVYEAGSNKKVNLTEPLESGKQYYVVLNKELGISEDNVKNIKSVKFTVTNTVTKRQGEAVLSILADPLFELK